MRTWRPGLPQDVSVLVVWVLAVQAIIRGLDYLPGDRVGTTQSLTVVERAMPLTLWGVLFIVGGVLVVIGMRRRLARLITSGATVLVGAYGALTWGLALRTWEIQTPWSDFLHALAHPHGPWWGLQEVLAAFPLDGWRTPASMLAATVIWAAIGWGTQVHYRAWEVTRGRDTRTDP